MPPPKTRCILPLLPPDILQRIFHDEGAIKFDNFLLCKSLLPHTLAALYTTVVLVTVYDFTEFCGALQCQPSLTQHVRNLMLISDTIYGTGGKDSPWHPDRGHIGGGQLGRNQKELEDRKHRPYDPGSLIVGPGLLKDLCRILPGLQTLQIFGVHVWRPLFSRSFLEENPFRHLVTVELFPPLNIDEPDIYTPEGAAIFKNLALIPSLRTFVMRGGTQGLPLNLLNLAPASSLAPRSLFLQTVAVDDFVSLGPESRVLFSALRPGLRALNVSSLTLYPSFMDDLQRLPPTIEALSVRLGDSCPSFLLAPPSRGPTFSSSALASALPALQHLHLSGPLLSPESIPRVIQRLPALYSLSLGPHSQVDGEQLTGLLSASAPGSPQIRALALDICACTGPSPAAASSSSSSSSSPKKGAAAALSSGPRRALPKRPPASASASAPSSSSAPRWPPGLTALQVRAIAQVAPEVELRGSTLCAAGLCGGDGAWGHRCPETWVA
ncbi:hypothetical protein JCM3770_007309 [Rhodotorula araucariae]